MKEDRIIISEQAFKLIDSYNSDAANKLTQQPKGREVQFYISCILDRKNSVHALPFNSDTHIKQENELVKLKAYLSDATKTDPYGEVKYETDSITFTRGRRSKGWSVVRNPSHCGLPFR